MPKHGWLDLDQMKAIGVQAADQAQSEAGDFAEKIRLRWVFFMN